jgi:RND family efflux transporter MFP subunit
MKNILIMLSSLYVLLLPACKPEKTPTGIEKTVRTDTAKIYGESKNATFPGKVIAASDINLAFRISGPISKVYADAGRPVKRGQLLAEIDSRDYIVQLSATEAEYNQIRAESERIVALYEKGSVTPNDYDKAVYGLKQITAKYNAHKNALADTKLYAPCDGYVQKRLFESGETVSAGTPVLSMISTGADEVEINIPSSDYIQRDNFAGYFCTADIYPDKTFPLELVGITRKANANQLYTMRLRLSGNDRDKPSPGMSAMVTILYKNNGTATVSVPLSAVFEIEKEPMVWVYDKASETFSARSVKISKILKDGTVVIFSGLSRGETVVSAGVHSLKEGEKVKLLPAVSPTNVGGIL